MKESCYIVADTPELVERALADGAYRHIHAESAMDMVKAVGGHAFRVEFEVRVLSVEQVDTESE